MTDASVKLRGHHLLCILTYVGRGYTEAFAANMSATVTRIDQGAAIELVAGPDDICAALHKGLNDDYRDADHCLKPRASERDQKALRDIAGILGRTLAPGEKVTLTAKTIADVRRAFTKGALRTACGGCEWHDICTGIAAGGYDGVKLFPHAR